MQQQTLFAAEKKQHKKRRPFTGFEMWKMVCRYSGRDFSDIHTPREVKIFTTKGVYTLPAGSEKYYFEGVL